MKKFIEGFLDPENVASEAEGLSIDKADLLMLMDHLVSLIRKEKSAAAVRQRIVDRLKKEIQDKYDGNTIRAIRLPWRLLEPSLNSFNKIVDHFKSLESKHQNVRYDIERLRRINTLAPTSIYVGLDEFEGYVVFYFEGLKAAVLECPTVGNAVYIIRGDWRSLSRLRYVIRIGKDGYS
ncbi:MAG: hypothetical protein WAV47_25840 [Blastocatellia bacterium]